MSALLDVPAQGAPGRFPQAALPRRGALKVLMTVDAVGGVWRYAMELARALKGQGVAVTFAGLGPRPTSDQRDEAARHGELVWLDQPLDWMVENETYLESIPGALAALVEERNIDLLHLNLPSQAAGGLPDIPVVVVSHSCVVSWWRTMRGAALPEEWRWQARRNRAGFARADAIVAPSAAHADLLSLTYGPLPGLTVVHNGISSILPRRDKEAFVFAAGRWWDEGKNVTTIDAAAGDLDWPVLLAGSNRGPDGQAQPVGAARRLGSLAYPDVIDHMQRAGIVLSPSLYEPFGLAALEGARAAAALALADIPTYRELWRDAAMFFEPRDPTGMSQVVNRLIRDPGLRADMAERALAASRRYRPDRQARQMADIYRELCRAPAEAAVGAG